jgi:hypothetical protein
LTLPQGQMIELWPDWQVIIWDWMNVYSTYSLKNPYIKNLSESDIYLWELCNVRTGSPSVLKINGVENYTNCVPINGNWILRKGSTYSLPRPEIVWTTAYLSTWQKQADNIFATTIKKDGTIYPADTWFAKKLTIRVTKPSVTTTGWGTSYVGSSSNISDTKEAASGITNTEWNDNFTWPSIWDLSSSTTQTTNTGAVDKDKINEDNLVYPSW